MRQTFVSRSPGQAASRLTGAALIILGLSNAACEYPFAPEGGERNPHVSFVSFDGFSSRVADGGALTIGAFPSDESFRLQPKQWVPIEIATSSGDVETLRLHSAICPAGERWAAYTCFQFHISLAPEHDLDEIQARVAAIGGRIVTMSSSLVTVTMPQPNILRYAREADSWPGVAWAWTSVPGCFPGGGCPSGARLRVPVPVDFGSPRPGDRVLQLQPGDTVRVVYSQPNGGATGVELHIP